MKRILGAYPDYGKAPASYLLAITEFMAGLTPSEQMLVADLKTGVPARCKFLPTIADMAEILNEKRAAHEQIQPSHTIYRKLEPEPDPIGYETDAERRKRIVRETLGYDPDKPVRPSAPAFETVPLDKLKSSDDLKTPSRPVSKELRQLLTEQGYEYFADQFHDRRTA